jgi:Endonuclease-reverse transcriptase
MTHAEELINFIHAHDLQWCLPGGTPTYWSFSRPGQRSTIDLILSNTIQNLVKYELYDDNFESDHRAIYSEWDTVVEYRA